ncbi:MAG: NAD-dependent deacylase [Nocardioides sp.]|jgi:NAD-dependent deacetylase
MRIVVLTGAGISAESGVPTFRDADGLWEGYDPAVVATPQAYAQDPDLVQRFYDERRAALKRVEPNDAHRALARLGQALQDDLYLVTQNVDDLHERGGSPQVHHMHGQLRSARCAGCGARHEWEGALGHRPGCPSCSRTLLRPDVVWFGEMPLAMDDIFERLDTCDLFVAIGTSAQVYPAAGFVHFAAGAGAATLELNLDATGTSGDFRQSRRGRATALVPQWVDEVLG